MSSSVCASGASVVGVSAVLLALAACSPPASGGGGPPDASGADSTPARDSGAMDSAPSPDAGPTDTFDGSALTDTTDGAGGSDGARPYCPPHPDVTTQPDGAPLPNLTVLAERMSARATFSWQSFSAASCDVREERCVAAAGCRRILRFDLVVANVGAGDLYLGPPNPANRMPPTFEHSACHNHYHLLGFAEFRLFDMMGRQAGYGHKQSFCLLDMERRPGAPDVPRAQRYACNNQGIHAGWADIYDRSLDCQYIDVTDVPAGRYRLQARINTECHLRESDYSDNIAEVDIDVPPATGTCVAPNPTGPCPAGMGRGLLRDCGWTATPPRACAPGSRVTLGCDNRCMPPLGTCAGDPMLRVCPGMAPCTAGGALAANDDNTACGGGDGGTNTCSRVTFSCPETGMYTVLTGPYQAGETYTCDVAVAP